MKSYLDLYWLLYEIENNKIKTSIEDLEDFLNVKQLKIDKSKYFIVDNLIYNTKGTLIDICVPMGVCFRNELKFTGIMPIVIEHVRFKIDRSWFLMDSVSRNYFGTKDTDRLKKAEKVLKTLESDYNIIGDGEGIYPIIDWESSIKLWPDFLESMFSSYNKKSPNENTSDDFWFNNIRESNFIQ